MRRLRPWLCGLWLLAFGLASAHANARAVASDEIERLAQAVASHPDDPDLLFALAQRLAADARDEAAVEKLKTLVARWPDHRPEASLLLGRLLYGLGRAEEAVPHLERATALDPESGPAELFLGLALQASGRGGEAEAHFERAALDTPELRAEAWLLAGLAKLERGDRPGGDELLSRAIGADPEGESARSARLVLDGGGAQPSRFHVQAYGGFEYDSNATLDSGDDFTGLPADQSDASFAWGTAVSVAALRGERFGVAIGGVYDQTAHLELHDWDLQQFGGALAAGWQVTERLSLRLDARLANARLDGDPYLLSGGLFPSLVLGLGPRAGWLRAFGDTSWYGYDETPISPALERDGFAFGSGLEHGFRVPGLRDTVFTWFGSWGRFDSEASRDESLGFEGDYDRTSYGGGARVSTLLPWRIAMHFGFAFVRERYANRNLIDYLTDDGVGTATPSRRRDGVWDVRLRVVRPVTRFIDLEISTRYSDHASNVDLYDYDRFVSGLAVRIHTP
jgi:tetratricopeptide (TPR) repeat protein